MAWKTVSMQAMDIRKFENGQATGTFTGKLGITTKRGPQIIWQFADEDGLPFGVYGFANLNRAMQMVKVGSLCRITYKGTSKLQTKFGLTNVHQVMVEIDDSSNVKEAVGAVADQYDDGQWENE